MQLILIFLIFFLVISFVKSDFCKNDDNFNKLLNITDFDDFSIIFDKTNFETQSKSNIEKIKKHLKKLKLHINTFDSLSTSDKIINECLINFPDFGKIKKILENVSKRQMRLIRKNPRIHLLLEKNDKYRLISLIITVLLIK
jgi:hypothetical protein